MALLGISQIFSPELTNHPSFVDTLITCYQQLFQLGAKETGARIHPHKK
ncbi:hypothetical protein [Celerinatantimonas yamalensis]|uniref:Uncharacterized protein n=1 Tax=Celerinatantimonas yamalensis TaxID=559956 RepID=A0ABW9G704_9GAMM